MTEGVLDSDSFLPLYEQLKQFLVARMEEGHLQPGDRLPSEKDLEQEFGVSRVTVRRALQELAHEERIVRVAGKGSFVLQPKIEPLTALTSFNENMRAQGYEPSYRRARINVIKPSAKISGLLDIPESQDVLRIERLMLADGLPMAIHDAHLPRDVVAGHESLFSPEVLNNISLYKILELEVGLRLARADEWVNASKARPDEAELLKIDEGDSILVIERLTFSETERPVEYVKMVFPSERYRYKVELFRPPKAEQ